MIEPFGIRGVVLDPKRLKSVSDVQPVASRSSAGGASTSSLRARSAGAVVSAAVLAETRAKHPSCRCEDADAQSLHVLEAGMYAGNLHLLGAGCTSPRWVCPRLDAVRRAYNQ